MSYVLSLCDFTGRMVEPWAEAGYECICVDLKHPRPETRRGNILFVRADVRSYVPPLGHYAAAFAFPPCTDVAVSGARWFRGKGLRALIDALEIFEACRSILDGIEAPYLIENPVSTVSTYWRKPDHSFDPCDYGDPWTKKTCLWTGHGFVMPRKNRVEPTMGSRMHLLPPSAERAALRSETPTGFARAVFEANRIPPSVADLCQETGDTLADALPGALGLFAAAENQSALVASRHPHEDERESVGCHRTASSAK